MRKVQPAIGGRAWVGKREGKIVAIEGQIPECTVEFPDGTTEKVVHFKLDTGWEFQGKAGNYVHESDPRVLPWLKKRLQKRLVEKVPQAIQNDHESAIELLRQIIRRNGG